jgi:hypothetical protein
MHKLYDFACKELQELEQKAPNGLTVAEFEQAERLVDFKKNILKTEKLENESEMGGNSGRGMSRRGWYDGTFEGGSYRYNSYDGGNSYRGDSYEGGSYKDGASGRRGRNEIGRFTSRESGFYEKLDDLMQEAPSESERIAMKDMIHRMKR